MVKITIKQQLNNIYELQKEKDTKTTIRQEQKQKELLLLNDLNYIIDGFIIDLLHDFEDNLYYLYNDYLNNKYNYIDIIYNRLEKIKIETYKEIATNNGFKYEKIYINKHNITKNNEYQTRVLIDELMKNKINDLIKDYKKEQKQKEYLQKQFINNNADDNKSPPNKRFEIMGMSPISFIFANIFAIFEAFGNTKKRR